MVIDGIGIENKLQSLDFEIENLKKELDKNKSKRKKQRTKFKYAP